MSFYTNVSQIGDMILHRWVDDDGERHSEFTDFSPTLYVPSGKGEYAGIRGEQLAPLELTTITEARETLKKYNDISNFKLYGNTNWWAQFINENYTGEIDWDIDKLKIANLDIEVLIDDPANPGLNPIANPIEGVNRVTAITVEIAGEYFVFGSKPYVGDLPENATHYYFDEESKLLYGFLTFWCDLNPDVVTGWNIEYFDIPYLVGRIASVLGEDAVNMLAPAARHLVKRSVRIREFNEGDGVEVTLLGMSVMDYLKMYKKFTYKLRERYSLDFIAEVELGEKKLDYSQYENLDEFYEKDYHGYIDYNIRDVKLVRRLDDKLNLMMLVMSLTYMCHIRHEDVFSQVRMWDTLIYNDLLSNKVVVPPKQEFQKDEKYEGAYVMEPKIGMHDWIVSFDLNSLYPHLIMQYNISPEMLVDSPFEPEDLMFTVSDLVAGKVDTQFVKDADLSMTANKAFFKRDEQGFLPAIMDNLYSQRKVVKKKMLEADSDVELIKSILKERGVEA